MERNSYNANNRKQKRYNRSSLEYTKGCFLEDLGPCSRGYTAHS